MVYVWVRLLAGEYEPARLLADVVSIIGLAVVGIGVWSLMRFVQDIRRVIKILKEWK